jgi:hypothetical protein
MIQTRHDIPTENVTGFLNEFKKIIKSADSLSKEDKTEWDLDAFYKPNYACIWNNRKNISEPCAIVGKDDRFAVVQFVDGERNKNEVSIVYRLEDLTYDRKMER